MRRRCLGWAATDRLGGGAVRVLVEALLPPVAALSSAAAEGAAGAMPRHETLAWLGEEVEGEEDEWAAEESGASDDDATAAAVIDAADDANDADRLRSWCWRCRWCRRSAGCWIRYRRGAASRVGGAVHAVQAWAARAGCSWRC